MPLRSPRYCLCVLFAISVLPGCSGEERGNIETANIDWANGNTRTRSVFYLNSAGEKVLHGVQSEWHENGQKRLEANYVNGRLQGTLTEWYADGQKAREGNWKRGREDGIWTAWQPTGDKLWEAVYTDGKIVGKRTWWLEGKIVREDEFDREGILTTVTKWHLNGQKMVHGVFRNGGRDGKWFYWDTDGKVQADGEWKDGRPWEGLCGVPAAGDAGSVGGLEKFVQFHEGVPVRE